MTRRTMYLLYWMYLVHNKLVKCSRSFEVYHPEYEQDEMSMPMQVQVNYIEEDKLSNLNDR